MAFKGRQQKLKGNALAAAMETTTPTFVLYTARPTHLNRTPAKAAAVRANKSSAKSRSIHSSKKTCPPVSISNSTGEAGRDAVRTGELRKLSLFCNLGWDPTSPNRLRTKSHSGRSGPDVKPISMRHRETGFGAYCL